MKITAYSNIYRLKTIWERLYQEADKVTNPFLSFTPNRIYFDVFHLSVHRLFLKPRFVYAQDGPAELILPIIIDRRRKRITEFAPLDYYDVLCSGSLELIAAAFDWVKKKYPGFSLLFTRVNQDAVLSSFFSTSPLAIEKCVLIPLDMDGYDDYFLSLSKHQRQNVRTAYNKLHKEGISISLAKYGRGSLMGKLKKECLKMYEERSSSKALPTPVLKRVYLRITKPVFRILTEMDSGFFYILYLNHTPAAVMAGAYSREKDVFVVPVLYSNNECLRHSPGILLINEVAKVFMKDHVKVLDLARGDEPYKYVMGGITHMNYSITF